MNRVRGETGGGFVGVFIYDLKAGEKFKGQFKFLSKQRQTEIIPVVLFRVFPRFLKGRQDVFSMLNPEDTS